MRWKKCLKNGLLKMQNKPEITISLNPSYFCSERCHFCYLTEAQLGDKKRLPLEKLDTLLQEVSNLFQIQHIDLYGGEPGLLPRPYIQELKSLTQHYVEEVNVNTNFITVPEWFHDDYFWISVSYDGKARDRSELVEQNILMFDRDLSVLSLASQRMINDLDNIFNFLSIARNVITWEIKPYSSNQSNQLGVTYTDYENLILDVYNRLTDDIHFDFINLSYIKDSLNGQRNAFSNNHVYITPNGQFGVLEFDLNDHEYFLELDKIEDYLEWCRIEKERVQKNHFCQQCEYFGKCLTEHYRTVKDLKNSCNGFINLLNYFKIKSL